MSAQAERVESVWEALGFPDHEEMARKSELVAMIDMRIGELGLSKDEAAKALGLASADLREILKGQFRDRDEEALRSWLEALL